MQIQTWSLRRSKSVHRDSQGGAAKLRIPGAKSAIADCLAMVALWNRADHYIFVLWLISSSLFFLLFSSLYLSRRRLDVCHASTHGVALVGI